MTGASWGYPIVDVQLGLAGLVPPVAWMWGGVGHQLAPHTRHIAEGWQLRHSTGALGTRSCVLSGFQELLVWHRVMLWPWWSPLWSCWGKLTLSPPLISLACRSLRAVRSEPCTVSSSDKGSVCPLWAGQPDEAALGELAEQLAVLPGGAEPFVCLVSVQQLSRSISPGVVHCPAWFLLQASEACSPN